MGLTKKSKWICVDLEWVVDLEEDSNENFQNIVYKLFNEQIKGDFWMLSPKSNLYITSTSLTFRNPYGRREMGQFLRRGGRQLQENSVFQIGSVYVHMNRQISWEHVLNLQKHRPENILEWEMGDGHEVPAIAKALLALDWCRVRESQFLFNEVIAGLSVTLQSPQQSANANRTNGFKKRWREGGVRKNVKLVG